MVKHALKFGTLGAVAVLFWFWMSFNWLQANAFFSFWGNLVILVVGVCVFFSLYFYAKNQTDFSFAQGLLLGGATILGIVLLSGGGIYVLTQYLQPQIVELYKAESLLHLQKNKEALIADSSKEIYETYLQSIPQINAYNSTMRYIFSNLIVPGLMLSILSALPLRKKSESNVA